MENNLMKLKGKVFEGMEVEIIQDENGEPLFELYSTGMALGQTKIAKDKIYPRKERIEKIINGSNIILIKINKKNYLDLANLSIFISMCHTSKKTDFIKCLIDEGILPPLTAFKTIRKEDVFFDSLRETLLALRVNLITQYKVLNYRLDGYIPELNLAIEYDEDGHNRYSYEDHDFREANIKKELNCNFVRVTDFKNNNFNIGLVIKQIMNQ